MSTNVLCVFRALVAVLALASFAGCSPKDDKSSPADTPTNVTLTAEQQKHIRTYTVARSQYHKTVDVTGVVDFDNDQATSILAPFSGPVSRLLVSPRDSVQKGQPLATVDSPDFATAISAYRKAVTLAETTRRLADMDKDLLAHQAVAEREEAQAQTDAAGAEADREAALQGLVSLGVDEKTIDDIRKGQMVSRIEGVIRSPIAGTVAERLVSVGQLLQAGTTPCFTVADLSRVWVIAQIFDSDLSAVSVGDTAKVQTETGSDAIPGTVDNISALVNPDTRSVQARVVVANPKETLKKQMYVSVELQSHQLYTGILIPISAILRDDENLPFVYVMQGDGGFARQHVTLGNRVGDNSEIKDGLKPGEKIVIDGAIFLQFMQSQ